LSRLARSAVAPFPHVPSSADERSVRQVKRRFIPYVINCHHHVHERSDRPHPPVPATGPSGDRRPPRTLHGEVDAYVGELMVAEGAQRRGIGTRLVRAAEQWARSQGLRHLTLETGAANGTARAFYAALGYAEEDVRLTRTIG